MKFIELHTSGKAFMVNLEQVLRVSPENPGSVAITDVRGFTVWPDESYDQIRKLIATAQGGIPMQPSEMY